MGKKWEGSNRIVIESTKPQRDDLTPITDIRGMGQAIAVIKRDVSDMRPEVRSTAKQIVELMTKQDVSENQIKKLEVKTERIDREALTLAQSRVSHDCFNANTINDLQEDSKKNALAIVNVSSNTKKTTKDVDELRKGQSKFVYWLLGAAFVVIGSVGAWYASYQVTTHEVRHLTEEQAKIYGHLKELQRTTKAIPEEIDNAFTRIETVTKRLERNNDVSIPSSVWCKLNNATKARLKRELSRDKIPRTRCKR